MRYLVLLVISFHMLTRRNWLKRASLLTAGGVLSPGLLQAAQFVSLRLSGFFPMGVASADVHHDSVILWTCYRGIYRLRVCVWASDVEPIWQDAEPTPWGYTHLEVSGLSPFKRYRYAFYETLNGVSLSRSIIGSFKTAPAPGDLVSLKFGAISCIKNTGGSTVLEHAGARDDLDFFLCNGDSSYNDSVQSLYGYQQAWLKTLSSRGCQMLRRSTSLIGTIDDHEIEDNFDPETINPLKLQAAKKAFFEHMPLRRNETKPDQIWRKFSFGATADIFVLDCRTERRPSFGRYMSRAQMDWLKQGLFESGAMFKIIMNSVPISEFPFPMASDRWEGYPVQRQEILGFIDEFRIPGILWVSGDFHFTSKGRVSKKGFGANQIEVLAGPGAQLPNVAGYALKTSSQFDWVHVKNSYLVIDCDVKTQSIKIEPIFGD
ncbi:MAG: alkaline phosphatase D family protein [Myxococcota bacterium]